MENDVSSLIRLPGVGKKTAERLIIEMRDRLTDIGLAGTETALHKIPGEAHAAPDEVKDAIGALVALGYRPQEASKMVQGVDTQDKSSEEIIRNALQAAVK